MTSLLCVDSSAFSLLTAGFPPDWIDRSTHRGFIALSNCPVLFHGKGSTHSSSPLTQPPRSGFAITQCFSSSPRMGFERARLLLSHSTTSIGGRAASVYTSARHH